MIDLFKIEEEIIKLVKEASKLMNKDFEIAEKGEIQNIVTTSDLNIQHFLFSKFSSLIPDSGFFCEEEDCIDLNHDYIWIIDPIDGTENYSRGITECCISVCLAYKKERIIGVVYNPGKDELYHAIKGNGAYLNNTRLHVSSRPLNRSIFCTSLCLYRKEYELACLNVLKDIYPLVKDFRRFASAALEICYLARGLVDMYFEMNLSIWDYSGAIVVLSEAGGVYSSYNQTKLDFSKVTMVLAANTKENLTVLSSTINKYMDSNPFLKL